MNSLSLNLDAINGVVNEARTISNALYRYVDGLMPLDFEKPEESQGMCFSYDDREAVFSMSRAVSRLLMIANDSLMKVSDILSGIEVNANDELKDKLKGEELEKLMRGL